MAAGRDALGSGGEGRLPRWHEVALAIAGGDVTISRSYEGLEAADIRLAGGTTHVTSSDDGVNASGSTTSTGGGGALDANGGITVTGGTLVAIGSTGMAESPEESSTQDWLAASASGSARRDLRHRGCRRGRRDGRGWRWHGRQPALTSAVKESPAEPAAGLSRAWESGGVKLYSDFAARRTRQIATDVVALVLIVASVANGVAVFSTVNDLSRFGRQMQDAGADFRLSMTDVGDRLSGVPLIGAGISAPFDTASGAGSTLEAAGQTQQDLILRAAIALGVGVAALPILLLVLVWLLPRLRFAVRATRTRAMLHAGLDVELLALRALTHQKVGAIAKVAPDALGAWRRRDPEVMRRLADLELKSVGIRV